MKLRSAARLFLPLLSALAMLAVSACGTLEVGVERTAAPTAIATTAGDGEVAQPTPTSTEVPAASPPTATSVPAAAASPTPPPAPSATPALVDQVSIFLVALDDNGASGKPIGCGDSVVAVQRQIAPTADPLKAALQELLSIHDRTYGESGLYNALYQSELKVDSAAISGGKASISLSGTMQLGGVCDNPRFGAQIEETARQSAGVQDVAVTINGVPLAQVLSLRG